MERESKRGVGRDAAGPHGYTVRLEAYLRRKGDEGATLDELVAVALDERWVGRGFANRVYADRINAQAAWRRKKRQDRNLGASDPAKISILTPLQVEISDQHPKAVRYCLQSAVFQGLRTGWCRREGPRFFSTGLGLKYKPQGGVSVEELTQTPEQIGADAAMREVIRMLRPYKQQKTHKVTQAEWNAIRYWLNLAAIDWQP